MSEPTLVSTEHMEVLTASGISKSFPGVRALDGVEISVRAGELTALLGENGAGKSTLMNILAGVYLPDEGTIELAGEPVQFRSPREAQVAGISIIFQELNLIGGLSIAENIFLGREPLTRFGMIDYRRMRNDAKQVLAQLEFPVDPGLPVEQLRVGEQQVVEIAKAVSFQSRIVIMDEPTSALTDQEVEVLFRLIQRLKAQGVGIVYITHKLDELPKIADSVTVLRDGQFIGSKRFVDVSRDEIIRMMVGRDLSNLFPKETATIRGRSAARARYVAAAPGAGGRLRGGGGFLRGAAGRSPGVVRPHGRGAYGIAADLVWPAPKDVFGRDMGRFPAGHNRFTPASDPSRAGSCAGGSQGRGACALDERG